MRTFYIMGTKKKCNEDLMNGNAVTAVEYNMGRTETVALDRVKEDAVCKFWLKRDSYGTPVAKSYGVYRHDKMKVE